MIAGIHQPFAKGFARSLGLIKQKLLLTVSEDTPLAELTHSCVHPVAAKLSFHQPVLLWTVHLLRLLGLVFRVKLLRTSVCFGIVFPECLSDEVPRIWDRLPQVAGEPRWNCSLPHALVEEPGALFLVEHAIWPIPEWLQSPIDQVCHKSLDLPQRPSVLPRPRWNIIRLQAGDDGLLSCNLCCVVQLVLRLLPMDASFHNLVQHRREGCLLDGSIVCLDNVLLHLFLSYTSFDVHWEKLLHRHLQDQCEVSLSEPLAI
mmetsp:Transcript_44382/g.81219  ORF Transcript_44382/g.81219 Transcript_44382/m.81219 type:complete len:259 (-) Transcript_44382:754-1530(-)